MANDRDVSKAQPGTPKIGNVEPRYGSLQRGTEGQKNQMRVALYRNRVHRLKRLTGLKRPPH